MTSILLEDVVAIENLPEILKVDGIDVFWVVPGDLAQSMGYTGQINHPEVRKVMDKAIADIVKAGRHAGTLVNDDTDRGCHRQGCQHGQRLLDELACGRGHAASWRRRRSRRGDRKSKGWTASATWGILLTQRRSEHRSWAHLQGARLSTAARDIFRVEEIPMAGVTLDHVSKMFGEVRAVNDLTIQIHDKEFLVLVGPSGCGKSTALRLIAGLEEITAGDIYIGDRRVNDVAPKDRDIAMVFQSYALYPHMTVYDNLAFGLKLRKTPKAEIDRRVKEAAEILGPPEPAQAQAEAALRRPAPARRARSRDRPRAAGLPDGRAALEP